MPHKKRKKQNNSVFLQVFSLLLIPVALLIAGYAGYHYFNKAYDNEQKLMSKELSEVKIPSDEEIRQEAAKSANMEYPVEKPLKTPEQISKEAEASARKMTEDKFNQKIVAEQVDNIIKTYKEADPGQKIEFISRNAKETVRGVYKGRDGVFVLVDNQKYSMRDILDEYRYLFDSDLATAKTQAMISEFKTSFREESAKYFDENRRRIEEELRASSGYVKLENGSWRAKSDIFEEAFNTLKSQKETAMQQEIQRITRKHRLFGFYTVIPANPPKSKE